MSHLRVLGHKKTADGLGSSSSTAPQAAAALDNVCERIASETTIAALPYIYIYIYIGNIDD